MLRYCYHAGGLMLLAMAMLAPAQAQQEPFHKRFEVGIRAGYLPLKLMRSSDTDVDYGAVSLLERSTAQTRPVTVGPSLVFRFSDRWAMGVDAMYRNVGYDQFIKSETSPDTGDRVLLGYSNERTRATFWDVPVLLRYTRSQQKGFRPRMTGMIGPAVRFTTGVESYRENVDAKYFVIQTNDPVKPAKKMAPGATVGIGMEWKDEIGVRVTIEGRFTRWQKDSFKNGPTATNRNTVELLLGLSF